MNTSSYSVSLASSQLKHHDFQAIKEKLKSKLPTCTGCGIERLSHYCIQSKCSRKQLVCVSCDVNSHVGNHFTHRFCYILPLFMDSTNKGQDEASESIKKLGKVLEAQISTIKAYTKDLSSLSQMIDQNLKLLQAERQSRGLNQFQKNIASFNNGEPVNLTEVFKGVEFMTNSECKVKLDKIRKGLLVEINKLNWMANPQSVLLETLNQKDESEGKVEATFPCNKPVEVIEIDSNFKQFYELYTRKLQYNPVILRLDSDYSSKPKMFETLMYHFRKCRILSIQNVNLNNIRTPLQFNKLKRLELVAHDGEPYVTIKSDVAATLENLNIRSFSIKRLKEDQTKFLKIIRVLFPRLLELEIEMANRHDLANNKDFNQFFKGTDQITKFSLRFRTEAQLKKINGTLYKFYKQASPDNPLQQNLIKYLSKKQQLTRLSLEGLKVNKVRQLFDAIKQLGNLFQLKLNLIEAGDGQGPLIRQQLALRNKRILNNRRIMAIVQNMYKRSNFGRVDSHSTNDQIIQLALGF